LLPSLGHVLAAVVATGQQLQELCRTTPFDLLITEGKLPDVDGVTATVAAYRQRPVPVILVSACQDQELVERALSDHVLTFLAKPFKAVDLAVAILLARRRFAEYQAVQEEAESLRQALEERKLIERAKGLVMNHSGVKEAEAYRRLHRLARDKSMKMVKLAETLLVGMRRSCYGSSFLFIGGLLILKVTNREQRARE
jgi:two-component system, response regulator PdtaR